MDKQKVSYSNMMSDIRYRYYRDTGTLSVYYAEAVPGLIDSSDEAHPHLLIDYSKDNRIVSFDVFMAADVLGVQFDDSFQMTSSHEGDALAVTFSRREVCTWMDTEDSRVLVGVSRSGHWTAIKVLDASRNVA